VPPVTKFLYPFIQQDQFPIVIQGLTKINISGMVIGSTAVPLAEKTL
jgi:hypothetical protein